MNPFMKIIRKSLIAVLLLSAATAGAQEDVDAAADTDADVEDEIVLPKAREQETFVQEYNIRVSPIGVLTGSNSLGVDISMGESWTIGPELHYLNLNVSSSGTNFVEQIKGTGWGYGARAIWFLNGAFKDGLYVSPAIRYATAEATAKTNTTDISKKVSGMAATVLAGYGWFVGGFNIMIGMGASLPITDTIVEVTDSNGVTKKISSLGSPFATELSLGWKF